MLDRLVAESPFVRRARRDGRRCRLFCFPHAGAGASVFATWPALLPDEVELIAVQLPGREDRITEAPFTNPRLAVRATGVALRPYLQGRCAFFGHSGGALLAFELARAFRRRGVEPAHLFLSGQPAPDHPDPRPRLHGLPDDEFRAAVRGLGGTAADVATDDDLMRVLLFTLRADFTLGETFDVQPERPLTAGITALGGRADERAPAASLAAWRHHTASTFDLRLFEGGHFYFVDAAPELTATISSVLLRHEPAHVR
jgi:medium-chain acyl-[acyl-carrier-protein] hydrolase